MFVLNFAKYLFSQVRKLAEDLDLELELRYSQTKGSLDKRTGNWTGGIGEIVNGVSLYGTNEIQMIQNRLKWFRTDSNDSEPTQIIQNILTGDSVFRNGRRRYIGNAIWRAL